MSEAPRSKSRYPLKFGTGALVIVVVVAAAVANVYADLAAVLSSAQQSQLLSGLVTVLVVLVVGLLFVAASVGREILSALRTLGNRARQIEEGNFDVVLETNRNDEFGEVYRALAAMRDGYEGQTERTEQLEQCVEDWTRDLELIANGDLSRRLDEEVDDPTLADLAKQFNEAIANVEQRADRTEGR